MITPDRPPVDIPGVTKPAPRELDAAARSTWETLALRLDELTELEADVEALKNELRRRLGRGDFAVDGEKVFSILASRRWDPEQARRVLPPEVLEQITVPELSAAVAEQVLTGAKYRECQIDHGKDRVVPVRKGRS